MQVDQATGCEAKFLKCVKEWPIEVVDPNAGTTATHPIRGWVLHKLVGACPTIDTRGTYACRENTPSVRGPPMDSVTGWPGKQTANEAGYVDYICGCPPDPENNGIFYWAKETDDNTVNGCKNRGYDDIMFYGTCPTHVFMRPEVIVPPTPCEGCTVMGGPVFGKWVNGAFECKIDDKTTNDGRCTFTAPMEAVCSSGSAGAGGGSGGGAGGGGMAAARSLEENVALYSSSMGLVVGIILLVVAVIVVLLIVVAVALITYRHLSVEKETGKVDATETENENENEKEKVKEHATSATNEGDATSTATTIMTSEKDESKTKGALLTSFTGGCGVVGSWLSKRVLFFHPLAVVIVTKQKETKPIETDIPVVVDDAKKETKTTTNVDDVVKEEQEDEEDEGESQVWWCVGATAATLLRLLLALAAFTMSIAASTALAVEGDAVHKTHGALQEPAKGWAVVLLLLSLVTALHDTVVLLLQTSIVVHCIVKCYSSSPRMIDVLEKVIQYGVELPHAVCVTQALLLSAGVVVALGAGSVSQNTNDGYVYTLVTLYLTLPLRFIIALFALTKFVLEHLLPLADRVAARRGDGHRSGAGGLAKQAEAAGMDMAMIVGGDAVEVRTTTATV